MDCPRAPQASWRALVGFYRFLHVQAWLDRLARPAVQRGMLVTAV
jgi:glutathione S-transferase